MEDWFLERLGHLRTSHESLRHGVHWALFGSIPEDWACRSCAQADREGQFSHELDARARVCLLHNRGRRLAVFRGEPVPGAAERYAFTETRLVETGETAAVPVRPLRSPPRNGWAVRAAEALLSECLPAASDCGLVVIVRGRLVRLEWFGHPHIFHSRARALLRQAAMAGLAAVTWSDGWVPGDALAALGCIHWGERRVMGRSWFLPIRLGKWWGSLVGWEETLLHLRLAHPDVFARPRGGRERVRQRGGRHAS